MKLVAYHGTKQRKKTLATEELAGIILWILKAFIILVVLKGLLWFGILIMLLLGQE
ncbi:MAG: hypothetical protein HQ579_09100 [Candidatus Omnitrophica bacterium]|nr:hypothetical protein [Candidatus Omnitrophota bacterium]